MISPRPRQSTLLVESYRNVSAHWRHSSICAVIALLCAFAAVYGVISSMRSLTGVMQLQTDLGASAFVVTSTTSQSLPVSDCEAVRNVVGVRSAGARLRTTTANFISAPDTSVTLWEVSPGFIDFVFPDLSRETSVGMTFGKTIATDLGATAGAVMVYADGTSRYFTISAVSALSVERVRGSMQAVMVPVISDGVTNSCFVEAHPAYRESVEMALVSWFGPADQWDVSPLATPEQFEIDIDAAVQSQPMRLVSPLLAGITVLVSVSLWWSRRQEFALYGLLRFSAPQLVCLLTIEWGVTVLAPATAGGVAAIAATGVSGVSSALVPLGVLQVALFGIVTITTPALGFVIIRSVRAVHLLKGA